MIAGALISYAVATLIPTAAILVLFKFLKNKLNLSKFHAFLGGVAFIIELVAAMLVMKAAFSADAIDYMGVYMPQWLYKTFVLFLVFFTLSTLRYFFAEYFYFSKENEQKGTSFIVGFGIIGGVFVALYCLCCFVYIAATAISTDFVEIVENSLMTFSDSTSISVFYPFWQHIAVALLFVIYTAQMLVWGWFMTRHAKHPFKWQRTFINYIVLALCETAMILTVVLSLSSINLFVTCAICILICAVSFVCVKYFYKYKEVAKYENQFD